MASNCDHLNQLVIEQNEHTFAEITLSVETLLRRSKAIETDIYLYNKAGLNDQPTIVTDIQSLLQETEQAVTAVLGARSIWKRGFQLAQNGQIFDDNLNLIKYWFDQLFQVLVGIAEMAHKLQAHALVDTTNLVTQIVQSSFIVTKQQQLIHTTKNFKITIRCLIDPRLLNSAPISITAAIISAKERAESVAFGNSSELEVAAKLNDNHELCHNTAENGLCAEFQMKIPEKIKRSGRVAEEKFAIAFQGNVVIGNFIVSFTVS